MPALVELPRTAVVLSGGEGIRLRPLTSDLPKGLVKVAKCERAIGGVYNVSPHNPITTQNWQRKCEAYRLQRKTGLRIVSSRLPSTAAKSGSCLSHAGQYEDQQRGWLASTHTLDQGLKQTLNLWNRNANCYDQVAPVSFFRPFLFQGEESGIAALVTEVSDWENPPF